jgi:MFS family permease
MPKETVWTRDFTLAWTASLFEGLSWTLFIHFPGFLTDLGADETEIGLLFGVSAIAAVAIRPLVGRMMDEWGRKPVIYLGNAGNIAGIALLFTVDSFGPWLYAVRILQMMGLATLWSSMFTYGADVVPASRRTEGFALFGVSGIVPIALGGIIGDVVLGAAGFTQLFAVALGCAVVALLFAIPLPERKPDEVAGQERRGFLSVVVSRPLGPIWLVTGGFAFVLTAYFVFLRTYVDETGIGSVGLFFGVYAATAIALRLTLGWLPERVGRKRVLYPSMAALTLGFVVLAWATGSWAFAVAGVLCGVGHGFGFPILSSYVVERGTIGDRGSSMAFFTALFDLGQLVAGPLLGYVIVAFGYPAMFGAAAACIAAVTLAFALWERALVAEPAYGEA